MESTQNCSEANTKCEVGDRRSEIGGRRKFGIRTSERCEANSEFGVRNDAKQIRNSEFGTMRSKFGIRSSEFGENVTFGQHYLERSGIRHEVSSDSGTLHSYFLPFTSIRCRGRRPSASRIRERAKHIERKRKKTRSVFRQWHSSLLLLTFYFNPL